MYYVVYCTYTCTYIDVLFIHTWKTVVVALSLLLFVLLIEAMAVKSGKYHNFFKGIVAEKDIIDLPGISEVLGQRLKRKGYTKAYAVLGQYLVCMKNEESFREWLHDSCGANAKQQIDCHRCIADWCALLL